MIRLGEAVHVPARRSLMYHIMRNALALCAPCTLLCTSSAAPGDDGDLAGKARAVLQTHCSTCHGSAGKAKGAFDYVLDRERLVNRSKVVPGKAAQSQLFVRVREGEMPPV